MPTYGYACLDCDAEFKSDESINNRHKSTCKCGALADRNFAVEVALAEHRSPVNAPTVDGIWEHIGPDPIAITSKHQLRDECKKHQCSAYGVFDS